MSVPAALILAGSRGGTDPLAMAESVAHKALITVEGQTMLARVAEALRAAGCERIAVSTGDPTVAAAADALGLPTLSAASGPSRSVAAALDTLGTPLVITTCDHALLRPEWVRTLIERTPTTADVAVMLARREAIMRAAPDTRRTYLRFADGAWSGCNLFLLAQPQAAAAVRLWEQVERDRKRPWRIVRRFGPIMLLRYAMGRLPLRDALARLGRTAGVVAAMVQSPDGAAAIDVDKPADLALVRRMLQPIAGASANPPPASPAAARSGEAAGRD